MWNIGEQRRSFFVVGDSCGLILRAKGVVRWKRPGNRNFENDHGKETKSKQ